MLTRRRIIRGAAVLAIARPFATAGSEQAAGTPIAAASRVRPRDPGWPSASEWEGLRQSVEGQLIAVQSPLDSCRADPDGDTCRALFTELKNPYFIGDSPALTQTCGWVDAWTAEPSVYAVAARKTAHVVAAVNFAREKNLRLVVKGGGHSYLGASNAADSLMIWTRAMNDITVRDAFVPKGCAASQAPLPAVTMGAGAIWMRAYGAVTTGAGRYVQGGGCGTVGVAGLVQGGGFGSYSKQFGTAGAGLLEAEIVTADGMVRIANACNEPDLFWALKGGGAGSFGVVTRLTLKTWDLPDAFGVVATTIRAKSDEAYRRLLSQFVAFYAEQLFNRHWGELAKLLPDNRLEISMNFQGLDKAQATAIWEPFLDWAATQNDLAATPAAIVAGPGRHRWDGPALEAFAPGSVLFDDRPGAPAANFFWSANLAEAGHFIHGFEFSVDAGDAVGARGAGGADRRADGREPALGGRAAFPERAGRSALGGDRRRSGYADKSGRNRIVHAGDRCRGGAARVSRSCRSRTEPRRCAARRRQDRARRGGTAQGGPGRRRLRRREQLLSG